MAYHASFLFGHESILELVTGHPNRTQRELGMNKDLFLRLIAELRDIGHTDTRHVRLEEETAFFLYTCVTGFNTRHISRDFQCSSDVITRYVEKMTKIFSSPPFYTAYTRFPLGNTVPLQIRNDPKLFPYFQHAIGVVDSSHIRIAPSADPHRAWRDRTCSQSQNAMLACDFDLRFIYALTGWEGSASNERVFHDALSSNLRIPPGKYLLADAGFPMEPGVLVPYRGVRYHLAEQGQTFCPRNKEELFNFYHESARSAIERALASLKHRFRILLRPHEFSLEIQARIPVALCAIHNFICMHDSAVSGNDDDSDMPGVDEQVDDRNSIVKQGDVTKEGIQDVQRLRDEIAEAMWTDYQKVLMEQDLHKNGSDADDDNDM